MRLFLVTEDLAQRGSVAGAWPSALFSARACTLVIACVYMATCLGYSWKKDWAKILR